MATERVLDDVVARALATATVDPDGPDDERCRFQPEHLAAVIRFADTEHNCAAVLAAVDRALQQRVTDLDEGGVVAATVLRQRVVGASARRQLPVENIQGDVGGGLGPVTRYEG